MTTEAPIPPEEHEVSIEEIEDEGRTKYRLTCPCDWEKVVEATPPTTGQPEHWARNTSQRHLILVGKEKLK